MGFSCRDVAQRASDHLEGALPFTQALRVRVHLWYCEHCRRLLRQMRALTGALALLGDDARAPMRSGAGAPSVARWRNWPVLATGLATGLAAILALLLLPSFAPLEGRVYAHAMDAHAQPGAPVPKTELEAVLGVVGAHLQGELPDVVYAHRCRVAGDTAAHLLLHTPDGVVVALLLAQRRSGREFRRGELYGHFEPFGSGTLAVLARDPGATARAAAQLRGTLAWR